MAMQARLRTLLLAGLLTALAAPAGGREASIDLHAVMVKKLAGSCVSPERLARFEPRMAVVHALVDQTSLPSGYARLKVIRPVLGGMRKGELVPVTHFRPGLGGARGARFVEGKEYLISMYAYRNYYIVDRALECRGGA